MFERGDLIYCPGSDDEQAGWCQDWGIIFKVDETRGIMQFHVHWLNNEPTVETEDWIYNHCDWEASI